MYRNHRTMALVVARTMIDADVGVREGMNA